MKKKWTAAFSLIRDSDHICVSCGMGQDFVAIHKNVPVVVKCVVNLIWMDTDWASLLNDLSCSYVKKGILNTISHN